MNLHVVILAAGKGTRMRSDLPKVLHQVAGKPLLGHVCDIARALKPAGIHVVYGHGGELVPTTLSQPDRPDFNWVLQAEQLGTGHAVDQAMPGIADDDAVLVLYGDVPLLEVSTLNTLVQKLQTAPLAILTVAVSDAANYGRIVRNEAGSVTRIVEAKDASADELKINEINSGILAGRAGDLKRWLSATENDNAQGEYYLTDVVELAVSEDSRVADVQSPTEREAIGVNSKQDLAMVERIFQSDVARRLMDEGLTLRDPARFDMRGELSFGNDCVIDINVIIEGNVTLGSRVSVGPNVILRDCSIADDAVIHANCVIEQATVGAGSLVGPFARLRPGAELVADVHVGNFVEIKNSVVGKGSKANHLAYVGDSEVGAGVNIGAGTITANYDGANKHKTTISDGASIGSNVVLVAPVTVGTDATIGAGSTIGKDAPDGQLTLTRANQISVKGWKRPVKKPK